MQYVIPVEGIHYPLFGKEGGTSGNPYKKGAWGTRKRSRS